MTNKEKWEKAKLVWKYIPQEDLMRIADGQILRALFVRCLECNGELMQNPTEWVVAKWDGYMEYNECRNSNEVTLEQIISGHIPDDVEVSNITLCPFGHIDSITEMLDVASATFNSETNRPLRYVDWPEC